MVLTGPYLPRAVKSLPYPQLFFFALAGFLSYLFPICHPDGIGIWPFYLILVIGNLLKWTHQGGNNARRIPVGPIFGVGFLSIAIPDAILTFERYGTNGIVGKMGLNDGLIYFGLIPIPITIFFWILCEWLISRDSDVSFSLKESLIFHLSPIQPSSGMPPAANELQH